jgi:hypothetical protein
VGKHRRISAAPSSPCAANAGGCTGRGRSASTLTVAREARSTVSPIGCRAGGVFIPIRTAAKEPRRHSPLRRFGLRGVAVGWVGSVRSRRPVFPCNGRNGQLALGDLDIVDSHGVAEPRHTPPPLTPLSRQAASHTAEGATLGLGGIPMSQIAPAVGTAPARRLRRPVADRCSSIEFIPATVRRRCDGSHHPASAAIATSRSALAMSNHSDMAAH